MHFHLAKRSLSRPLGITGVTSCSAGSAGSAAAADPSSRHGGRAGASISSTVPFCSRLLRLRFPAAGPSKPSGSAGGAGRTRASLPPWGSSLRSPAGMGHGRPAPCAWAGQRGEHECPPEHVRPRGTVPPAAPAASPQAAAARPAMAEPWAGAEEEEEEAGRPAGRQQAATPCSQHRRHGGPAGREGRHRAHLRASERSCHSARTPRAGPCSWVSDIHPSVCPSAHPPAPCAPALAPRDPPPACTPRGSGPPAEQPWEEPVPCWVQSRRFRPLSEISAAH